MRNVAVLLNSGFGDLILLTTLLIPLKKNTEKLNVRLQLLVMKKQLISYSTIHILMILFYQTNLNQ